MRSAANGHEEIVHFLRLEVMLDELLRLFQARFLLDHLFGFQIRQNLFVHRNGVAVQREEHHIRLHERMNLRQFAQELAGVALADALEPIEAQRVLALEDLVQATG